jgi:hypothetical protein
MCFAGFRELQSQHGRSVPLATKCWTNAVANVATEFGKVLIKVKSDRRTAHYLTVDFGEVERGPNDIVGKIHAVM